MVTDVGTVRKLIFWLALYQAWRGDTDRLSDGHAGCLAVERTMSGVPDVENS